MALSRINDALLSIPSIMFALVMIAALNAPTIPWLILITAIIYATSVFRIARSLGQEVMVSDFVEAARVRGEGLWWVITREVLPNIAMPFGNRLWVAFRLGNFFIYLFPQFPWFERSAASIGLGQHGKGEFGRVNIWFASTTNASASYCYINHLD